MILVFQLVDSFCMTSLYLYHDGSVIIIIIIIIITIIIIIMFAPFSWYAVLLRGASDVLQNTDKW